MENYKIEISTKTILKTLLVFLAVIFIWAIRDIVIMLLLVFVIVAALGPVVDRLQNYKIPRPIGVLVVYLFFVALVVLLFALIIPPLITQIKELANDLPYYSQKILPIYNTIQDETTTLGKVLNQPIHSLSDNLNNVANSIFQVGGSLFNGIGAIITVIVLTFYLLLEEKGIKIFAESLIPKNKKESFIILIDKISVKWGGWLRGQFLLMLIIGIANYIGLLVFDVPFALALAMIAGFMEIVPYLGPILGAAPAILIALVISPWTAVFVAIWYIVVQQLENHILVPKIMQKSVGLSPITTIIALLIGAKLMGIIGMVLAVPIAAGAAVTYEEWLKIKNNNE